MPACSSSFLSCALTADVEDEPEAAEGDSAPESRPEPPAWNEGSEWGASFDAPSEEDVPPAEYAGDDEEPREEEALAADDAPPPEDT